jgi:hypothetical protein
MGVNMNLVEARPLIVFLFCSTLYSDFAARPITRSESPVPVVSFMNCA